MLLCIQKYTVIKLLWKDTKCKIYKTLIRPMVPYRCKNRTLKKTDEGKLGIFEKILKKIYSPTCVNGVQRIKYDNELYSLYKEPSTVKMIKTARLKWLEHTARMEDNAPSPTEKVVGRKEGLG